jgi:hypothetical protein
MAGPFQSDQRLLFFLFRGDVGFNGEHLVGEGEDTAMVAAYCNQKSRTFSVCRGKQKSCPVFGYLLVYHWISIVESLRVLCMRWFGLHSVPYLPGICITQAGRSAMYVVYVGCVRR